MAQGLGQQLPVHYCRGIAAENTCGNCGRLLSEVHQAVPIMEATRGFKRGLPSVLPSADRAMASQGYLDPSVGRGDG